MEPAPTLTQLLSGAWVSQCISVAAKLGIADELEAGPRSQDELARAVKAEPRALYRVLRALASVGVFSERADGRFELPSVVAGAKAALEAAGVAARCKLEGGDFFEKVPQAEAHILSHIIHDWEERKAVAILENVRRAQPKGGRLLLCEGIVPPPNV